ncbi:SDR family NAD(P)-dependent oxidoreductase [Paractinoplanes lichenicola]|uniref:SDR family oxidoreductase n=1 Tax=Paractinoplanes lichenicola TaxID=2802976 RepID=A0ABS1VE72_9ACTN|nr:SDR family NAD(P)-dependent oxidoreductase [Actinoplanes lichenicola]MBL7252985.1 SDR family oxidoreductase [Actinoplanes lichenicola]
MGAVAGAGIMSASSAPAPTVLDGNRRFAGKVVLITGATSGIGRASALAFAREGAALAFCGRRAELGRGLEDEIRGTGGQALFVRADVRDEGQVRQFVNAAADRFGRVDVALNNAGITIEKPLHEFTAAEFGDVLDTNVRGVFYAMKYQIPHMLTAGGGTILVTSSTVANTTSAKRSVYTASKSALVGLVRAAALDYGDKGIRVTAILPGTTDTALVRGSAGLTSVPDAAWRVGAAQWGRSNVPGLRRMATPEEIAAFAVSAASPELTYLTGTALAASGGTGAG